MIRLLAIPGHGPSNLLIVRRAASELSGQWVPIDADSWKLYPNPATLTVKLEADGDWESYKVVDVQGRVVAEGGQFANQLNINTAALPNGLYRLVVIGREMARSMAFQILR